MQLSTSKREESGRAAGVRGASRSVASLARGGVWGEPMEVARYCGGRVNGCQPLKADAAEDFVLDSFCDVRFEQAKFASLIRIFLFGSASSKYINIYTYIHT